MCGFEGVLRSHSNRLLCDHVESVSRVATGFFDDEWYGRGDVGLNDVVSLVSYVHDIGKGTVVYQKQFFDDEYTAGRMHAPVGAVAAYIISLERGWDASVAAVAALAVGKHHGQLSETVDEYIRGLMNGSIGGIDEQVDELAAGEAKRVVGCSSEQVRDDLDWIVEKASNGVIGLDGLVERMRGEIDINTSEIMSGVSYRDVIRVWSALTTADKIDASGIESRLDVGSQFDPDVIETNALSYPESDLNQLRNTARNEVLENLDRVSTGDVATITLPTGIGKTYTGIQSALKLQNMLNASRVVFALPFTSIIDETLDELHSIYDFEDDGNRLTIDHYLSDTVVTDDDTVKNDTDEYNRNDYLAGKMWRTPFTLTTFVKLFETVIGPSNSNSLSIPALQNSVILLDEPQAIPEDKWEIIAHACEILTDTFNATIIFMTATQPSIFQSTNASVTQTRLVDNTEQYYNWFDRVQFNLDASVHPEIANSIQEIDVLKNNYTMCETDDLLTNSDYKSYTDAATELYTTATPRTESNQVLAICNTIASSNHLHETITNHPTISANNAYITNHYHEPLQETDFDSIASELTDKATTTNTPVTIHITTNHPPKTRLALTKLTTHLKQQNCPLICTATQLIEAGVDISFTHVYRDYAPIDSLVQAAGRCNRNQEQPTGLVTIWHLPEPPTKTTETTPAHKIYGSNQLSKTNIALENTLAQSPTKHTHTIPESLFTLRATQTYYNALTHTIKTNKSHHITQANLKWLTNWSLIKHTTQLHVILLQNTDKEDQLHNTIHNTEIPIQTIQQQYQSQTITTYPDDTITKNRKLRPLSKEHGIYTTTLNTNQYHTDKGLEPKTITENKIL